MVVENGRNGQVTRSYLADADVLFDPRLWDEDAQFAATWPQLPEDQWDVQAVVMQAGFCGGVRLVRNKSLGVCRGNQQFFPNVPMQTRGVVFYDPTSGEAGVARYVLTTHGEWQDLIQSGLTPREMEVVAAAMLGQPDLVHQIGSIRRKRMTSKAGAPVMEIPR